MAEGAQLADALVNLITPPELRPNQTESTIVPDVLHTREILLSLSTSSYNHTVNITVPDFQNSGSATIDPLTA